MNGWLCAQKHMRGVHIYHFEQLITTSALSKLTRRALVVSHCNAAMKRTDLFVHQYITSIVTPPPVSVLWKDVRDDNGHAHFCRLAYVSVDYISLLSGNFH